MFLFILCPFYKYIKVLFFIDNMTINYYFNSYKGVYKNWHMIIKIYSLKLKQIKFFGLWWKSNQKHVIHYLANMLKHLCQYLFIYNLCYHRKTMLHVNHSPLPISIVLFNDFILYVHISNDIFLLFIKAHTKSDK